MPSDKEIGVIGIDGEVNLPHHPKLENFLNAVRRAKGIIVLSAEDGDQGYIVVSPTGTDEEFWLTPDGDGYRLKFGYKK